MVKIVKQSVKQNRISRSGLGRFRTCDQSVICVVVHFSPPFGTPLLPYYVIYLKVIKPFLGVSS